VDVIAKTVALEGANGERTVVGVNDKTTIMSGAKKIALDALHKDDCGCRCDCRGATVVATYTKWSTI
jgi:hypothetical protein